jgi:hypothetical protein
LNQDKTSIDLFEIMASKQELIVDQLKSADKSVDDYGSGSVQDSKDDVETRCHEVLTFGSPFEALKSEFVTPSDLLKEIVNPSRSIRMGQSGGVLHTLVAYRAICTIYSPEHQYLKSETDEFSKHFLSMVDGPMFGIVYLLSGGDPDMPIVKPQPSNDTKEIGNQEQKTTDHSTVASVIVKSVVEIARKTILYQRLKVFCSIDQIKKVHITNFNFCRSAIQSRNLKFIEQVDLERRDQFSYVLLIINEDWFDVINRFKHSSSIIFTAVVKRCHHLIENAPLYWANVVQYQYYNVLKKWKIFDTCSVINAIKLAEMFPEFPEVDPRLTKLGKISKIIIRQSPIIQGYLLGFPLHQYIANRDDIIDALVYLEEVGVDRYYELLAEKHRKLLESLDEFIVPSIVKKISDDHHNSYNNQDTLLNDISSYSQFDVVKISTEKYSITRYYTRPEFDYISRTKKCPYDRTRISPFRMREIRNRIEFARRTNLPKSTPLIDQVHDLLKASQSQEPHTAPQSEVNGQKSARQEQSPIARVPIRSSSEPRTRSRTRSIYNRRPSTQFDSSSRRDNGEIQLSHMYQVDDRRTNRRMYLTPEQSLIRSMSLDHDQSDRHNGIEAMENFLSSASRSNTNPNLRFETSTSHNSLKLPQILVSDIENTELRSIFQNFSSDDSDQDDSDQDDSDQDDSDDSDSDDSDSDDSDSDDSDSDQSTMLEVD